MIAGKQQGKRRPPLANLRYSPCQSASLQGMPLLANLCCILQRRGHPQLAKPRLRLPNQCCSPQQQGQQQLAKPRRRLCQKRFLVSPGTEDSVVHRPLSSASASAGLGGSNAAEARGVLASGRLCHPHLLLQGGSAILRLWTLNRPKALLVCRASSTS